MKSKFYYTLFTVIFLFVNLEVSAQEEKTLNLAKGRSYSETIEQGTTIKFLIKNKIPRVDYKIVSQKKDRIPEVLVIPKDIPPIESIDSSCNDTINEVIGKIWDEVKDEDKVPDAITKSRNKISELNKVKQDGCIPSIIASLNFLITQTEEKLETSYKLGSSQTVEVTVLRDDLSDDPSEDKEAKWHYKFESPMEGQWVTTYGFSFVAPMFEKSEKFYSKTSDSIFVVTQENTKSRPQFIPSVFFTWLPNKKGWSGINFSGTGGLGFDFEAPTVFVGLSLFYHHNISLNLGIVAHQQEFLRGKYTEGQILGENLSADQLHEELYTVNPFISLSFRLGKNPFSNTDIETTSEVAQ